MGEKQSGSEREPGRSQRAHNASTLGSQQDDSKNTQEGVGKRRDREGRGDFRGAEGLSLI